MHSTQLYQLFQPSPRLAPYIEDYYIIQPGGVAKIVSELALPDGGIYLIFSLEGEVYDHSRKISINPQTLYVVGTMTHLHKEKVSTNTKLFGIHFKPACFSFFFDYPIYDIADKMVKLQQINVPDTALPEGNLVAVVEKFLVSKLSEPDFNLQPILLDIYQTHGNIGIDQLTSKHFLTERKLERLFKRYTGIPPQTFSKIIRFDYALNKIRHRDSKTSLLDIAFDCGYYDHAHLTREVKKYTGLTPSQL